MASCGDCRCAASRKIEFTAILIATTFNDLVGLLASLSRFCLHFVDVVLVVVTESGTFNDARCGLLPETSSTI